MDGSIPVRGALLGVLAFAFSLPAAAGNLTRCDQARLAAHDAIVDRYDRVLAALDRRIAQAARDRLHVADFPYRDAAGAARTLDLAGLKGDLQRREAADAGRTDRVLAGRCHQEQAPAAAARKAASLAADGIVATVAARTADGGWPASLFGPPPEPPPSSSPLATR